MNQVPQHGSDESRTTTREHLGGSSMLANPVCQPPIYIRQPTPGSITLIVGCMFSGKTTALIKHLEPFSTDHRVIFKHASDTRYHRNAVVSHNGLALPALPITRANELDAHCGKQVTLVGLDEGHFFNEQVIAEVLKMASVGISIVITSLDRDSWGEPFPLMHSLTESADHVTVLTATCAQCGGRANRTQRLTPIINGNMLGGCESYEPRCPDCWRPPPEDQPQYCQ